MRVGPQREAGVRVAQVLGDGLDALAVVQERARVHVPQHVAAVVSFIGDTERRARLELDKARAYAQRRQVGEAVAALRAAERLTPEYIQTHPLVRQTIRELMQISRHTPAELLELAERAAAL